MRALRRLLFLACLFAVPILASDAQGQVDPDVEHRGFSVGKAQEFFADEIGDTLTSIYLNELFGPLFPSADRPDANHRTVFSTIIGYFNIIALGLGGLLFAWNATAGLLQTAHEGELLGRRWSSLWAPMRIVFAVGMLVPLPGLHGYNAVQAGVAYLVRGTTMTATFIWSVSAKAILIDDIPVAAAQPRVPPDLVETMYRIAACQAIVESQLRANNSTMYLAIPASLERRRVNASWSDTIEAQESGWLAHDEYYRERRQVEVRLTGDPGYAVPVCGWWETPKIAEDMAAYLQDSGLTEAEMAEVLQIFRRGHIDILTRLYVDLLAIVRSKGAVILTEARADRTVPRHDRQLAAAYIRANGGLARLAEEIFNAVGESDGKTGETARGRRKLDVITGGEECAASKLVSTGELPRCFGQGWVMAGAWYMHIARLNGQVTAFMRAQGRAGEDEFFETLDQDEAGNLLERGWDRVVRFFDRPTVAKFVDTQHAATAMGSFRFAWELDAERLVGLGFPAKIVTKKLEKDHDWSIGDLAARMSGLNLEDAVSWLGEFVIGGPGEDPLVYLIQWGDRLLTGAGAIMVGLLVLPGAAILAPAIGVLWAAGALLQLILPMMPWILWVVAVTGYFLLVVEAVVGVSLWAFAHLKMDGEGISGDARNGWTLLLALVLTPILMVIGFLVGMVIFRITSGLLLAGVAPAAHAVLAPASIFTVVLSLPAIALMIAVMQLILVERSFSLVTEFPNRVLNWIGGRADLADQGALERARIGMIGATAGIGRAGTSAVPQIAGAGHRLGIGRRLGRLGSGGDSASRGADRGGDNPTGDR